MKAKPLMRQDGLIDWTKTPRQIFDFIRGTMGWPSAYTFYKEKRVQLVKVILIPGDRLGQGGTVIGVGNDGIDVITGGGILRIVEVKPEGKGVMPAAAFACGNAVKVGDMFYA
jgi:methionyl-tRNA formyltransferase